MLARKAIELNRKTYMLARNVDGKFLRTSIKDGNASLMETRKLQTLDLGENGFDAIVMI